ncbi:hypothetical protein Ancab_000112 [Ancistrocladus abbreviatus]
MIHRRLEHLSFWLDSLMAKLNKCIFRSWTEEQFEKRWWQNCSCHLFEYHGYLCRHAIIVLQMSGTLKHEASTSAQHAASTVPSYGAKYVSRCTTGGTFAFS